MQPYYATVKFMNILLQQFTAKGDDMLRPSSVMVKKGAPEDEYCKHITHVQPDWRYHWSLNVDLDMVDKMEHLFSLKNISTAQKRRGLVASMHTYEDQNKPMKVRCPHKFGDIVKTETTIFAKCKHCEHSVTMFASKQNWKKG